MVSYYATRQSRQKVLTVLGAIAALSCAAALLLNRQVAGAARDADAAFGRVRYDGILAGKYLSLSASAIEPSAEEVEARSREFLNTALGNHGLPREGLTYSDPTARAGGGQTIRINIECDGVPLASGLGFMSEVENGRRNLALIDASFERTQQDKDVWDIRLVYGAIILPAKSRT